MDKLKLWFEKTEWPEAFIIVPHHSVNSGLFAEQYGRNPELWESMLGILAGTDFSALETGRHEVDGENLFFMVNHYVTREPGSVQFEIHRKYIDLQYVFGGKELIGTASPANAQVTVPYNPEKDIAFYKVTKSSFYMADPSAFLLFFPEELHQPGVMVSRPEPVKKVVFKIKMIM